MTDLSIAGMRSAPRRRTSVITINKDRDVHLSRLLEGVGRGVPPDEMIVVDMGNRALPPGHDNIIHVPLTDDGLPLAKARNSGRRAASGDLLVFLDVDCIPSRDLISSLSASVAANDGLVCSEVFYLGEAVADGWNEADLSASSVPHPARKFPTIGVTAAPQAGLFWSLAFGISAGTFDRLGGFDEDFCGYGAEDTDLAFRAAALKIPILFSAGGHAFHQRHAAFDPPLTHFADIVRNATIFRRKHGQWPMRGWLDAFAALGLIVVEKNELRIVRPPTSAEIAAAAVPSSRAF